MDTMLFHEVPRAFREDVCQSICDFSVGLIRLDETREVQEAQLGGSGTLVQVGALCGILTAAHVIKYLKGGPGIGLILANVFGPRFHRVEVPCDKIGWLTIAYGEVEGEGPDLGFLALSVVDVGTVKAQRSFYNLVKRERLLEEPPALDTGLWFLCGFADEATTLRGPERGYRIIKSFEGACGMGPVRNRYRLGGYDYLDYEVSYDSPKNGPPLRFGGFSGGGLWQVLVGRKQDGGLHAIEHLLSGVAFYESEQSENRKTIRCHAQDGIYRHALQAIRKEFPQAIA